MQSVLNTASTMSISTMPVGGQPQAAAKTNLLLPQFASAISRLSDSQLASRLSLDPALRLFKNGDLESWYTPFEHVNESAKIVVVGITPGETQLLNALREARAQLRTGASFDDALKAAKHVGAFSGPLRQNLIALLDHVGFHAWLGISSTQELFGASRHLLHSTSILPHAVFIKGKNYNGTPDMLRHPVLRQSLIEHFSDKIAPLKQAVFVPLGDKVAKALDFLASEGLLSRDQILDGLPHPSPANIERIRFFTGQKLASELSVKTNAEKLVNARNSLMLRVQNLKKIEWPNA
jgi:hypothetical protein